MAARHSLTRQDAARLLGVGLEADHPDIKRAFRLWAAWAHPDQGGSAERFAELCAARDRLLEPEVGTGPGRSAEPDPSGSPAQADATLVPRPRRSWGAVLVRPTPLLAAGLVVGFVVAVACVLIAGPVPLLAVPAAVASAAWCVAVSRVILSGADHGHVIVTRSIAWAAATGAQFAVATLIGIRLVEVLPLLAVPFVAVIAAVNPAAGLWRGGSR
jgi:hypothetical protein